MRSIRLVLGSYLLVLLSLCVVAVLVLGYNTSRQSLRAKADSNRALLLAQYDVHREHEEEMFDKNLLRRARTLNHLAQSQLGRVPQQALPSLGLLGALAAPWGYVLAPAWIAEAVDGSALGRRGPRRSFVHVQYAEAVLPREEDGNTASFFQIFDEHGNLLQHSASLESRSFPLPPGIKERLDTGEWEYNDAHWSDGVPLRCVTYRAPITRVRILLGGSPGRGGPLVRGRPGLPPERSRTPPGGFLDRPLPTYFFQCGVDTIRRDERLAGFQSELNDSLGALEAESQQALATLRERFLWIGLATFVAAMAGGWWLISVGLAPLRRLSDAVSRVSEKNFRLHFDAARLPAELRPICERLNQTLDLLERAFAREKQAAENISHELRTPLAALLTTLEVGLRKPREPAAYDKLLRECRESGRQMSRLVERLLTLARMDAGADQVRHEEIDLAALAGQCIDLVQPLSASRGVSVYLTCVAPVQLHADRDKVREILMNLLDNAIEYNRPEGRVDIGVERDNGEVCLSVRDTGMGIPSAAQAHIFERFFRADGARPTDGLHAGLGLAIINGYVGLMGGKVAVESVEGEGSTFRVRLPAGQETGSAIMLAARQPLPAKKLGFLEKPGFCRHHARLSAAASRHSFLPEFP